MPARTRAAASRRASAPTRSRAPRPRSPRAGARRASRPRAAAAGLPAPAKAVLEKLGRAIAAGDAAGAAACFAYPSLVLSGVDVHAFGAPEQAERMFRNASDWYRGRGLALAGPEVESAAHLGGGVFDCTVRWPALDGGGREASSERAHYIVQESTVGTALVRVAVTATAR